MEEQTLVNAPHHEEVSTRGATYASNAISISKSTVNKRITYLKIGRGNLYNPGT